MPVLFLVIFASIFRNNTVKVPGGTIKESVYYVPGHHRLRPDHRRVLQPGPVSRPQPRVRHLQAPPGHAAARQRRHRRPRRGRRPDRPGDYRRPAGHRLGRFGASIPSRTAPAFVLDIIVGAAAFCCLGFAAATLIRNVDAVQPVILGHCPAAVLHLRHLHPHLGAARLAGRHRQRLPRPSPRRRPAGCLQPLHDRVRAELGLPRHPGRLGRGRPDRRPPPVQLASPRRLTAGRNA